MISKYSLVLSIKLYYIFKIVLTIDMLLLYFNNIFKRKNCKCNITLYFQKLFQMTNYKMPNHICLVNLAEIPRAVQAVLRKADSRVDVVTVVAHVYVTEMLSDTINTLY